MKRIKKRTIRRSLKTLIAALLIACICLQENFVAYASTGAEVTGILNTQKIAEDNATESQDTTTDNIGTETATPEILYEIEEKRDEYTKHFKLSDGTTMAVSYQEKVHYLEDGEYKEINATLAEGTEDGEAVLGNDLGDIAVKYAKKSNKNKLLTIGKGDSKIKIALEGANKVDIEQLTDAESDTETGGSTVLDPRLIVKNKASVIYKDILKNTDVAYISTGDYLKENIILKNADVPQTFTFSYKGSHLAYRKSDNGEIELYSTKDEQNTLYRINAPFMTDATGNYSNDVTMDISEKGNTIYVTLTPDKEFLKTATYPVIIDPPIETDKEYRGVLDTFVNEVYPNDSAIEGNGSFLVGRNHAYEKCRGYIKFENLPKLSAGDVIIKGYFSIYQFKFSAEGAQSFIISAYENTGNWNETVTWNTKPGYGEKVDHVTVGPIKEEGTTVHAQQKLLDITRLARKWYSGQNYGLMLMSEEESSRYAVARFFASDYPFNKDNQHYTGTADLYPSGIFVYRNTNGLENYWSYHSAGDGLATTGYVNDATGALTLTHTDFSESGNVMPLTLVRTYNSNTAGAEAARGIKSGKGWQLNINQYIYHTTLKGVEYYAYVDGDGTTHYISKNSEDKWVDEDGLELELTISGTEYTIKDASDSKAHFKDVSGKIYLYKLTDVYGNSITVNYSGNYERPVSVTDGVGRKVTFTYNSAGRLATLTDPAGRVTSYTYDGNGNLTKITYPDGMYTQYAYTTSGNTSAVTITNSDNTGLIYTLDGNGRVTTVTAKGAGSTQQLYKVTYPATNVMRYTYDNGDTDYNDGISEDYQSDNFGRVLSITNSEGYGAYCGYTENKETDKSNNKVTFVSDVQKSVSNLIINGGAETDLGSWTVGGTTTSGMTAGKTPDAKLGNYAWAMFKGLASGTYYRQCNVNLQKNKTYTLSGYIKTTATGSGTAGAKLYVKYYNSAGVLVTAESEPVRRTGDEWKRVSVTFTNSSYSNAVTVYMGMTENSGGTTKFDCIQLEEGETANRYNAIENGSFELGTTGVTTTAVNASGATVAGAVTRVSGSAPVGGGSYFMKVEGKPSTVTAGFTTTAYLNVPADTNVVVSAYAKATAAAQKSVDESKERLFGLEVEAVYTDGTSYTQKLTFNDALSSGSWQYLSGAVNLSYEGNRNCGKTVKYVSVKPRYNSQVNDAYFDLISLYVEEFGTEYAYDKNGKLVTSADAANQSNSYSYGDDNLKKLITPTGSNFEYAYDKYNNVIDSTDANGIRNVIKYDAFGNPVYTLTQGESRNKVVTEGKTYYIRNALTGKYLTAIGGNDSGNSVGQAELLKTFDQMWNIQKNTDGSCSLYTYGTDRDELYVGTVNNAVTAGAGFRLNWNIDADTKYVIERAENGTYIIRLNSDRDKVITGSVTATRLQSISGTTGDLGQQWYFEEIGYGDSGTSPSAGKSVYIYNYESSYVIMLDGPTDEVGEYIMDYSNAKTDYHKWTLRNAGSGYYYIESNYSKDGKVLGVRDGSAFAPVLFMENDYSDNVKFKLEHLGDKYYKIVNKLSGCALESVYECVVQYSGSDTPDSVKWYFQNTDVDYASPYPYNNSLYYIKSPYNNRYLECNATSAGQSVSQNVFTGSTAQKFLIKRDGNNIRIIPAALESKGLELARGSSGNLALAGSTTVNSGYYFTYTKNTNGTIKFTYASDTSKCLRLPSGATYNSGEPVVDANSYNLLSQWVLEYAGEYMESSAEYTSDGNYLTKVTGADGNSVSYAYDTIKGNLTSVTEPGNRTTSYTYNAANDLLTKVSQSGSSVAYEYVKRKLTGITSPNGTKYTFTYNDFSQCTKTIVGNRTLATNSFDTLGRLKTMVYGNGNKVENVYDNLSRVTSVKYDNVTKVNYTYDNDGNVSKIDDKFSNITSAFRYDSIKRPISKVMSNGYTAEVRYDDKNRVESTVQSIGNRVYNTAYVYDKNGLIIGVKSTHNEYKVDNSYDWDELNRVMYRCIEVYTEENGWEEIGYQNISYKPGKSAGSTTSLVSHYQTNRNSFEYSYDDRGNITQIIRNGVVEATYTYDSFDRLVSETLNGVTTTWTYDANGNILTRTSNGTTVKYTYGDSSWKDLLTNYNGQSITYDNIGNPLKWGNTTFTWAAGRRLMSLSRSGVNASFTYDIDGYRTSKTVNGVTTTYYVDGGTIAGLKKGTDELFFIYDEKGYSIGFYYNGEPFIYVKNIQGDVIGIVDKSYKMVVTYSYDAWGKLLEIDGELADTLGTLNPFRYRGYVYDDETGLYYLNSRYYDPGVGRFINSDGVVAGVGQEIEGYNLFAYCFDNPVNMSDPSGDWPICFNLCKTIVNNVVRTVGNIIGNIIEDCKNYDKNNESEEKVIEAHYVSSYKGTPVIKAPIGYSGFSYGIIFIGDKVESSDTVKHEQGHIEQLKSMGIKEYTTKIVVPSVTAYVLEGLDKLPYDYYGSPWEAEADRLGGVNRTKDNNPWPEDAYDSYDDLIKLFFR